MNKEEVERKIRNKESIFDKYGKVIDLKEYEKYFGSDCSRYSRVVTLKENEIEIVVYRKNVKNYYFYKFDEIFSTKKQAQHYLDNGNVTRIETMPFITWEEFKKEKYLSFLSNIVRLYELELIENKIILYKDYGVYGTEIYNRWEATEENFYKAYDECKKVFLEDNIEED